MWEMQGRHKKRGHPRSMDERIPLHSLASANAPFRVCAQWGEGLNEESKRRKNKGCGTGARNGEGKKEGERAYTTRGRRWRRTRDKYATKILFACKGERMKFFFSLFLLLPLPLKCTHACMMKQGRGWAGREKKRISKRGSHPPPFGCTRVEK